MSSKPERKPDRQKAKVVGFLGVGFDSQEGEHRLTRSEHFFLLGGSQETHERMQETAIKFTQALQQRGKSLPETSLEEILELFDDAQP